MILSLIKRTVHEYNLFKNGDSILIGLSGGADSVCLTHALWTLKDELGLKLYTAHVNHGIRDEEAKRDEDFVKEFSKKLGIECFVKSVDIPKIAKQLGQSEEMAGRQIRYNYFNEICENHNIKKIATAHNKNDNAETILMNFIRGSSLKGLGGIPFKRDNIVRPILNISREAIENYCSINNLDYMTDSTNLSNDYTRNKIRHDLLPLIKEEFNSNFINTVTENAFLIRDEDEFLNSESLRFYNTKITGNTVIISDLLNLPKPIRQRAIRLMLKDAYGGLTDIPMGYVFDIMELINKTTGKKINIHGGLIAKNEYGKLIIENEKHTSQVFRYEVPVGKTIKIPEINKSVTILRTENRDNNDAIYISCDSFDKIIIRSRLSGDKFFPIGMSGTKKVKEYLINIKVPKDKRNEVPIVEINTEIAVVGNRVDRRFAFKNNGIKIEFKDI